LDQILTEETLVQLTRDSRIVEAAKEDDVVFPDGHADREDY